MFLNLIGISKTHCTQRMTGWDNNLNKAGLEWIKYLLKISNWSLNENLSETDNASN